MDFNQKKKRFGELKQSSEVREYLRLRDELVEEHDKLNLLLDEREYRDSATPESPAVVNSGSQERESDDASEDNGVANDKAARALKYLKQHPDEWKTGNEIKDAIGGYNKAIYLLLKPHIPKPVEKTGKGPAVKYRFEQTD